MNLDNRLQVRTPQYVRDWWEDVHAATYSEHRLTFPQWIRAIITKHCEEVTGKPLAEPTEQGRDASTSGPMNHRRE